MAGNCLLPPAHLFDFLPLSPCVLSIPWLKVKSSAITFQANIPMYFQPLSQKKPNIIEQQNLRKCSCFVYKPVSSDPQRKVMGSRSSCDQDPSLPWPQLSALSTHYDDFARIMITMNSCISILQPLPSKCSVSKGGNRRSKVLFALLIFKSCLLPQPFQIEKTYSTLLS